MMSVIRLKRQAHKATVLTLLHPPQMTRIFQINVFFLRVVKAAYCF